MHLKGLATAYQITPSGAAKILVEMVEKGFIKKMRIEGRKYYMATDIDILDKSIRARLKNKVELLDQTITTIKEVHGSQAIKIERLGDDGTPKVKAMVKESGEAHEFADVRNLVNPPKLQADYKDVKFTTVYLGKKESFSFGTWLGDDQSETKYPDVLVFDKRIVISLSNEETLLIHNDEIANMMRLLIDNITNQNKKAT